MWLKTLSVGPLLATLVLRAGAQGNPEAAKIQTRCRPHRHRLPQGNNPLRVLRELPRPQR